MKPGGVLLLALTPPLPSPISSLPPLYAQGCSRGRQPGGIRGLATGLGKPIRWARFARSHVISLARLERCVQVVCPGFAHAESIREDKVAGGRRWARAVAEL